MTSRLREYSVQRQQPQYVEKKFVADVANVLKDKISDKNLLSEIANELKHLLEKHES